MAGQDEKLRWEGTPLYGHHVKVASGCMGTLTAIVAIFGLLFSHLEPARYPWPVVLAAAVLSAVVVLLVVRERRSARYRITNLALHVATRQRAFRWLVPRDVTLAIDEEQGRSILLGEIPVELTTTRGAIRTTRTLRLDGLGPDAEAVLRALEEARTDETYAAQPLHAAHQAPKHVTELCAKRTPLALADFLARMPADVPPAVSRAVRGAVARACSVPVDYVTPEDTVSAFMRKRDYVDYGSFLMEVEDALRDDLGEGVPEEEKWLDETVARLASAITLSRRPREARRAH